MACQAISSCFEVSLMARQIHQGNNLAGARNVIRTRMSPKERVIEDATFGIQLQA